MKSYNPTPEEMKQYEEWRRQRSTFKSNNVLHQSKIKERPTPDEQAAIDAALNSIYNGQ